MQGFTRIVGSPALSEGLMDEFRTDVKIRPSRTKITHESRIMLIGSCFSESMGEWLDRYKFPVDVNPFGPLYNPESIRNGLQILLDDKRFEAEDLVRFDGSWVSFHHHGRISHQDRDVCLKRINTRIRSSSRFLREARFLFITLGSAWVYELCESGRVVSNCHRMPAGMFRRRLLSKEEVVGSLERLLADLDRVNPRIRVIFTISPIRHMKDGAFENQVSKAVLHIGIHELLRRSLHDETKPSEPLPAHGSRPGYFPSYEIMMDDLRDYRFYEADMIHPNGVAIQYIWERFGETYFDEDTIRINDRIEKLVRAREHRPIDPSSARHNQFLAEFLEKTRALKNDCPFLDLTLEFDHFQGK